MTRISIIGGSGYAGGHVVAEAAKRGHQVISYSRGLPATPVAGVENVQADVLVGGTLRAATQTVDVVVSALSPRGPLAGRMRQALAELTALTAEREVRLGVIGGAGTLRIGSDGPMVKDTDDFPAEFKAEADELGAVLRDLQNSDTGVDWFYVSPAAGFGSWAPGTATGTYRVGGDELLLDADGKSEISGADLAAAVLDEIEVPTHRRARWSVAY